MKCFPSCRLMLCLLAGLLAACDKPVERPAAPRPVVVASAGGGVGATPFLYPGEVRSRYEVDLAFRVGGKLVERRVNPGDPVRQGQVLARLDPADIELARKSAVAQLAAAEADQALARTELERAQALLAQKFVSASVVDARRTQLEAASARVAQARAARSQAENQLGYATLTASRDGVVTAVPVEAGQVLAAGQLAVRIADPASREVLIWIPEGRTAGLRIGQPALVRAWNAPGRDYRGSLRELAASADATTRTYAARVRIEDADAALGLGASAGAGFLQAATGGGVEVPLSAVQRGEGNAGRVWVLDADNRVQARAVSVVAWRDERAVIGSGLAPGERVVSVGAHALTAGEVVRPVDEQAPVVLDAAR